MARLRERTYEAVLRQEVEYAEKGEGDVVSRINSDASIVGETVTANLSDGLRAVVAASVGRTSFAPIPSQPYCMLISFIHSMT